MVLCLLGLGSNQGDRVGNLVTARDELRRNPALCVKRVSSFHETAPIGGPSGQDNYLNAAAVIETELAARELVDFLLEVEQKLGRERRERWGPRTIDLDLLLYGDSVIESLGVSVPHPRMHERPFVLAPAAEIAADWRHPLRNQSVDEMLAALPSANLDSVGMRVLISPSDMQQAAITLRREGRR